ncbi:MAG: FAD:protein transferase [Nocardioidaceae bacterium]|jgi:thiamine biosynthesis lipoprotein|nr:FAD:protein transferase [Nocardioidaceae bacterium]
MPLVETLPIGPGVAQWPVWTTTARVVTTDPSATELARCLVEEELAAVDLAASRFRDDSEVVRIAATGGGLVHVSPLLAELVAVALQAAADTDGAVDPTLGSQLSALGYGRTFDEIAGGSAGRASVTRHRQPSWRDVVLDGSVLSVPNGVILDLGATAKAWAADRCANLVAQRLGTGALVALGGDIAVAGTAPAEGWTILVQDGPAEPASLVTLEDAGGLATSSTLGRSWTHWNRRMHHILDPVTCRPAPEVWRTVSVAAASCLAANTLTTAAVVRGTGAPRLLRDRGVPARLVGSDGSVTTLNGWPEP